MRNAVTALPTEPETNRMTRRDLRISMSLLLLTPCVGLAGNRIDPNSPAQGLFADEWLNVYLAGGKVGYAHSTMTREGNKIRTGTTFRMRIGRADQTVEIAVVQTTTETLSGKPLAFSSSMDASQFKTNMEGTITDGKVTIVTSQFGMKQEQQFDFPTGAIMTWGIFRDGMLRGLKPGLTYKSKIYTPDMRLDDAVVSTTTIGEREMVQAGDTKREGWKITAVMDTPAGSIESVSWVDDNWFAIKSTMPAPGLGDMVLLATSQRDALADFVSPEMFMTTTIAAGRHIDRSATKSITYHIRPKDASADLGSFPTTGAQRTTVEPDGTVTLSVARQVHRCGIHSGPGGTHRCTESADGPMAEFLGANLMMNTNDPELVKLAKKAARGETDPYRLGDRLRRFVTQHVSNASLDVGFATASEVCRTRKGDCSEFGVLLAALGRINGLPSRVAAGLAYVPSFGGRSDIFGYHLWTQFHIDGRWVDFDSALRESDCSPTRIIFATSSLKSTGLADLSLPLLDKIGAIDIDIVRVEEIVHPKD